MRGWLKNISLRYCSRLHVQGRELWVALVSVSWHAYIFRCMVLLRCCKNAILVFWLLVQAHAGKQRSLSYDAAVCYVCFVGVKLYYYVAAVLIGLVFCFLFSDVILVLDTCWFVLLLTCIGWVEYLTTIEKNNLRCVI